MSGLVTFRYVADVALQYSDVMGYMTWVALVMCFPVVFLLAFVMPNNKLGDGKDLASEKEAVDLDELNHVPLRTAKITT